MKNDATESLPVHQILLAEDDEVNQEIVRALLADVPEIVLTVVGDGRAAIEAALGQRFDLMIFDRNMPQISGDRVIRYLRTAATINAATPIIQMTADVDHVMIGSHVVGDVVVPKPIRADVFMAVIRDQLAGNGKI